MDEDLYDEFGNYIGPPIDEIDDAESAEENSDGQESGQPREGMREGGVEMNKHMEVDYSNEDYFDPARQIVLHEDKQYYPAAEKVFGKDVQALVQEEDA